MPAPVIVVNVIGWQGVETFLMRLMSGLSDTDKAALAGVHDVAEVWKDNFYAEGSRVGGWPALAEATANRRVYYGFDGDYPILAREPGATLRYLSTDFFVSAGGASRDTKGDSYSSQTTEASLGLHDGIAALAMHGWKVSNQYDTSGDRNGHPARPYWFVDDLVTSAFEWAVSEWTHKVIEDAR